MAQIKICEYEDFEIFIDPDSGLFRGEGMSRRTSYAGTAERTTLKGIKRLIDIIYREGLL